MINEWSSYIPVGEGGGLLQISSEGQVFLDLKFLIPVFLGAILWLS